MQKATAEVYLRKLPEKCFKFVGRSWVGGKLLDLTEEQIEEYIIESLHMGDPVEKMTTKEVQEDMALYFEIPIESVELPKDISLYRQIKKVIEVNFKTRGWMAHYNDKRKNGRRHKISFTSDKKLIQRAKDVLKKHFPEIEFKVWHVEYLNDICVSWFEEVK